jgi:arylamine N-acetyltransferase
MGLSLGPDRLANLSVVLAAFSRIPYENLTKIIGVSEANRAIVKHTPEQVIEGFISRGTGGTCFPLTLALLRLIRALGFEAFPIIADRRYGTDTHCALICCLESVSWHLIDPGYLITNPCKLPSSGTSRYTLPITSLELRALAPTDRVELYTTIGSSSASNPLKYRLTYKTTPVDEETFHTAWDRSFDWEMMTYPIISSVIGDTQVYVQKNNLIVRSSTQSTKVTLDEGTLIREVGVKLGLAEEVVRQALTYLRTQG